MGPRLTRERARSTTPRLPVFVAQAKRWPVVRPAYSDADFHCSNQLLAAALPHAPGNGQRDPSDTSSTVPVETTRTHRKIPQDDNLAIPEHGSGHDA